LRDYISEKFVASALQWKLDFRWTHDVILPDRKVADWSCFAL